MSLFDAIDSHIKATLQQLYTALPGNIVKVKERDGGTVVDIKLGVNRILNDGRVFEEEVIYDVPLIWPSANGCYITMPVEEGDTVLVYFAMRACPEWKNGDGGVKTPSLKRLHDRNDAFAVPAMLPYRVTPKVDSDAVRISSGGTEIRILKDGTIELGEGATERLLKGDSFLSKFLAHTHTYSNAGTPTLTSPVSTVISTPDSGVPETVLLWEETLSEVSKTK